MRRSLHPDASRREGVILMVVLTMLTLFAVVGLMAVLYAGNSARSSLIFSKGWQVPFRDTGGTELFRWAFGQLIYDVPDNAGGVQSAIRGHSLARTMYGYNDGSTPTKPDLNIQPFNGLGRIDSIYTSGPFNGFNDRNLINYTYVPGMPLRDPEYPGSRSDPTQLRGGAFVGGANPPVTYPDLNNLALAASRADGTNLMPSLHRPWLFGLMSNQGNPNWTNVEGRFITLRPRPADHYGFPYPADDGGDVKNKLGYPGGNDSIWIDLGYPERVAADGRRYKPLFAFRVEDLDGKINLNTAGNLMGGVNPNETHNSNQGWGKWEQSIARILNSGAAPLEWRNLFLGNPNAPYIPSRYGQDRLPFNGVQPPPSGKAPRFFGPGDLNASDETNSYAPTGPIKILPASPFPVFPGGYESGSQGWSANARHFNYFNPFGPSGLAPPTYDSLFPISDQKKLLVNSYTGIDAMSANVSQLTPNNLGIDPAGLKRRNLITVLSMDMARLGISPWLYDQGTSGTTGYASPADPQLPPSGGTVATSLTDGAGNRPRRAVEASLEAINLDQELPRYPHQDPNTPAPNTGNYNLRFDDGGVLQQAFNTAQIARQNMAAEIFKRLLLVTGVKSPTDVTQPTDAELIPIRWMAQLAANIVDFIDEDEISTPFKFYPIAYQYFGGPQPYPAALDAAATAISSTTAAGEKIPRFWVFGTELPPVVLNEVYAQFEYKTDPTMMNMETSGQFAVKVWAELYNPFPKVLPTNPMTMQPTVQPQDNQGVPLHIGAGAVGTMWYSPYKLVVANAGGPQVPRADNDNVNGAPDKVRTSAVFDSPTVPRVDAMAPDPAMAVNPQQANGFFLMGPKDKTRGDTIKPARVPGDVPYFQTDQMKWDVVYNKVANTWTDPNNGAISLDDRAGVTVMLRRLANPHLPEQGDPTVPNYNPYITMDYIDKVQLNDVTTPKSDTVAAKSQGKKQPYASERAMQIDDQTYAADPLNQHTLGVANSNSGNNNWLVHLDRQVISPFELLNVSGFRSHMLTQKFNGNNGQVVPWLSENNRLYRVFAFLTTPDRAAGVSANGRHPGKINLNTIWDKEIFDALCDASASNTFTQADVDKAWINLNTLNTIPRRPLNGTDRPILDLGAAFLPANDPVAGATGRGLDDTFVKMFQTGNANPYLNNELLTKIANSVTTRSNTFAVWLTTGFFEVVNHPTTGLPVLGEEIDRSQGQEIRYRFFAIVDRTQLVIAPQLTSAAAAGGITPSSTPQTVSVVQKTNPTDPLGGLNGTITYNGGSTVGWSIGAGSVVVIDRGTPFEETVVVTAADTTNNTFTAVFRREHLANMTVTMHGNPGPQPNWDPANPGESLVVPYWELLN